MKRILTPAIALAALSLASAKADTIAQWTFENTDNTAGLTLAPGANTSPGTVLADSGLNSSISLASGLHSTVATYSTPAGDLDPDIAALDPGASDANAASSLHSFSANGWSVGDYWSFTTSTLGFFGVTIAFDQMGSNTGPADFGLSYSINGGAFTQFATYSIVNGSWNTSSAKPSSLIFAGGGAFDNANTITFELIDLDTTAITGGTVASSGTDRVDNFTVVSVVPEPSSLALAAVGGFACLFAIRRKK
ncbi:MAG TPA: PEP-CTERM sorting domain-containing protein [Verrucomicrobiae bacterium]|nr:PEP-CTERM sorting domain-containing protein [Verrucomicrobiae bacterium]